MSSKQDRRKRIRRDIKQAADLVRREMRTLKKDFLTGSDSWKKSTAKAVQETAPKVSKALDETMTKAGEIFSKTMNIVDKEARETQVDFLRFYRSFLSRQVEFIDRRLKKMKNSSRINT